MKTNKKLPQSYNREGGEAAKFTGLNLLERLVLSCMLWENQFYQDGDSIGRDIKNLVLSDEVSSTEVSTLAYKARSEYNLRHVSLYLCACLLLKQSKTKTSTESGLAKRTIIACVQRADEMAELISMYWFVNGEKTSLAHSLKTGLADCFNKFDEYQFAKYDRPSEIKLVDVMRLCHPKPKTKDQEALFKKIATGTLSRPNTWESRMAGGEDKREVFTDLLVNKKLGYMALLRNLRGMLEAGVDESLIRDRIANPSNNILPYRFIAAAKHAPRLERDLDAAMIKSMSSNEKLFGKTVLLVDVSWSMVDSLSGKSDLKRIDAANGLAILLSSICDDLRIATFSNRVVEVAPRQGMALADAIWSSQSHNATRMADAIRCINNEIDYDRIIVITDEQSQDGSSSPKKNTKAYMINVASCSKGVAFGQWNKINGFSEACVKYIQHLEKNADQANNLD